MAPSRRGIKAKVPATWARISCAGRRPCNRGGIDYDILGKQWPNGPADKGGEAIAITSEVVCEYANMVNPVTAKASGWSCPRRAGYLPLIEDDNE
jgi:hypothetical protein